MSRIAPINQRFVNAENSFLEILQKQGGISREGAEKVLTAWRKHKLVKVDSFDGRISVKHGGLLDRENILESFRHVIEENSTCRYCKSGVKANPQASPEDYSEKLKTLTAKQLSAEEKRQELFSSALNKKAIEEGYGNYRYSDMRAMQDPPAFIVQQLDVADKQRKIALEIEKRYAYSGTLKPIKGR